MLVCPCWVIYNFFIETYDGLMVVQFQTLLLTYLEKMLHENYSYFYDD